MDSALFTDTHFCHLVVSAKIRGATVLDVGGTGRMGIYFPGGSVTDANIADGIDGCDLSFKDGQFDTVVSVNTLEHVGNHRTFINEALRCASQKMVMCFPFLGHLHEEIERIKAKIGEPHSITQWPRLDELKEAYPKARFTFGMPWYLHLALITGKGHSEVFRFLNGSMPLHAWYPLPIRDSWTAFMEIDK